MVENIYNIYIYIYLTKDVKDKYSTIVSKKPIKIVNYKKIVNYLIKRQSKWPVSTGQYTQSYNFHK